ncbi:MAG: hypothetical protein ABII18_06000, partial [bacterium]
LCPDHPFYILADEIDYQYDPVQNTPYEVTTPEVLDAFNQITTNDIVPNFENPHQVCLSDSDIYMAASQSRLTRFGFSVYNDDAGNFSKSYFQNVDAFLKFVSENTGQKIYRFPKCIMIGDRLSVIGYRENINTETGQRTTDNEIDASSDRFMHREFEFIDTFMGPFREIVMLQMTLEQKEHLYEAMQDMDYETQQRFLDEVNSLEHHPDQTTCFKVLQRIMSAYIMPFFFEAPTLTIHYLDYK